MRGHRGLPVFFLLAILGGSLVVAPSADAAALPSKRASCGQTITKSFRLANNLLCPDNGLIVGKKGITIDLGGHRISTNDFDANESGILNLQRDNVTIRNGVIAGYAPAVQLVDVSRNTVDRLTTLGGAGTGIRVYQGSRTVVKRNTVTGTTNNAFGITLEESTRSRVIKNTVTGRGGGIEVWTGSTRNTIARNVVQGGDLGVGIHLHDGNTTRNVVKKNRVIGMLGTGISVSLGANKNTISKNVVRANGSGIALDAAPNNPVTGNTVTGNRGSGLELGGTSTGVKVSKNVISAQVGHGIFVGTAATGASIRKNVVVENGEDGIAALAGSSPLLTGNRVSFNGYLNGDDGDDSGYGIFAPGALAGSGGNKAVGNDAPGGPATQCNPNDICVVTQIPTAPASLAECGQDIATDFTLHNPLECSLTTGLDVTGDDITLNLGLHWVSGDDPSQAAVDNSAGHDGVTIIGGVLARSAEGVLLGTDAQNNRVTGAIVTFNQTGIEISGDSDGNIIENNRFIDHGGSAVLLDGAQGNIIRSNISLSNASLLGLTGASIGNTAAKNTSIGDAIGIGGDPTAGGTIKSNKIIAAGGHGIAFTGNACPVFFFACYQIEKNIIRGSQGAGISMSAAVKGIILRNRITASGASGIVLGNSSDVYQVTRNTSSKNNNSGISVSTADVVVTKNKTAGNGLHGIFNETPGNTLSKNTANSNGFRSEALNDQGGDNGGLGISAIGGTLGSKNKAKGNDNPDQCLIDICP